MIDEAALIISDDGTKSHLTSYTGGGVEMQLGEQANGLPCAKYIIGAGYNQVRLYNSCETCKDVTIAWSDGVLTRHKVQPDKYVDIIHRAQASEIVKEKEC